MIGMAGETWCHSHGDENAKKSAAGSVLSVKVATFRGLALLFKKRPEPKKRRFPAKYS